MSTSKDAVSIAQLARTLLVSWDTRDLVSANESVLRIVRVEGTMDWHRHEEDQLFICWEGRFTIELEGSEVVDLEQGDVFVVPRRTQHKTSSSSVAIALMSIGLHTMARG
ncbi:MAG TPA: cupin domain-containing protein [Candidatus Limnocylindrales bacterium]|nr:cupin domain-containing protein [Candidatus Limnocylindrales bacterium]